MKRTLCFICLYAVSLLSFITFASDNAEFYAVSASYSSSNLMTLRLRVANRTEDKTIVRVKLHIVASTNTKEIDSDMELPDVYANVNTKPLSNETFSVQLKLKPGFVYDWLCGIMVTYDDGSTENFYDNAYLPNSPSKKRLNQQYRKLYR